MLLVFWILLFVFRVELLYNLVQLWEQYFLLLANDFIEAIQLLNLQLLDVLLSAALFILIPVLLLVFRKKLKWLNVYINFSSGVLLILLLAFVFAPIITDENPEFQKDLRMTKLLPPLSKVKVLHLKGVDNSNGSSVEKFLALKNQTVKQSYDDNVIFIDNLKLKSDRIIYLQKEKTGELDLNLVQLKDGDPVVTNRFFILGADEFGRDIFTRLIFGVRISILVGIGSVVVSLLIGLTLGFVAGTRGGIVDILFSRLTDLFLAFPIIYLIILILAMFGNSLLTIIIVLGLSGWMSLFKIVKSEVLSVKNKDYITTAIMMGLPKRKILTKEILPVIMIPLVVNIIFQFSNVILAESALSYLGLGTGNSYPSWGAMIESGQQYIAKAWWMILFPGIVLIFTLFSANNLGKKLNKANISVMH
jgi:peptide/nickel transport system permease protein